MACLGAVLYDPATAATASKAALLAMTAFDTTNARITFTAPANGNVLVKIRVAEKGSTFSGQGLLGVLQASTVKGRQTPMFAAKTTASTNLKAHEAVFLVTGLAGSVSLDAAHCVETLLAATQYGWGGPNNTTANDAYGALSFEVWETANLLAGVHYDPAAAVSKSTAALLALTALDTTNLRLSFTAPASGRVFVRLRGTTHGAAGYPSIHLGVLSGSTVIMRATAFLNGQPSAGPAATDLMPQEASAVISGLSGAQTWDAAYAVEGIVAASGLKYGGPNNTTANDAFGGFTFEVWSA